MGDFGGTAAHNNLNQSQAFAAALQRAKQVIPRVMEIKKSARYIKERKNRYLRNFARELKVSALAAFFGIILRLSITHIFFTVLSILRLPLKFNRMHRVVVVAELERDLNAHTRSLMVDRRLNASLALMPTIMDTIATRI